MGCSAIEEGSLMGTLTKCLSVSSLIKEDQDHVLKIAEKLRTTDGLDHAEANRQAVEMAYGEYTAEHQGVVDQIEKAGGVIPDEWRIEAKKPKESKAKPAAPEKTMAAEMPTEKPKVVYAAAEKKAPVEKKPAAKKKSPVEKKAAVKDLTDTLTDSKRVKEAVESHDLTPVKRKGRMEKASENVKRWIKRNFTKEGLMNEVAFETNLQSDAIKNVGEEEVGALVHDLEKAIKKTFRKPYGKVDSAELQKINDYIGGKDVSISEELKPTADALRAYLDNLSLGMMETYKDIIDIRVSEMTDKQKEEYKLALDTGGAEGKIPASVLASLQTLETISGNIGSYLNRSYQAFDDPKWKEKTLENTSLIKRAETYIREADSEKVAAKAFGTGAKNREELIQKGADYFASDNRSDLTDIQIDRLDKLKPKLLTEGEIEGAVSGILEKAREAGDFSTLISKGAMIGGKDISITKRRKDIPPVIRELLGEYKDPRINFDRSASKMQWYMANHHFLMNLRERGLDEFLFEKPVVKDGVAYDAQIVAEGSKTMNPLDGLYTSADFKLGMKDALDKFEGSELMRQIVRINSMVKYGKTILSPTTQMRNFQSAAFFAISNGHFNWKYGKKAFGAAKADLFTKDKVWREYLNKLIKLGVLHDNPYAQELKAAVEDFVDTSDVSKYTKTPKQKMKSILGFLQKTYQVGDDFWKIIGFENEYQSQLKAGLSKEEAEKKAAFRIRNGYPTYSMVPRGIKKIRRWPLIGTFVSFPYEIVRTTYNQAKFIKEDLKDNKVGAAKRILGMSIAASAAYSASKISMVLLGMDDDDDEAVRAQLPEWSRNSQIVYLGYDKDGLPIYYDASYIDPYTYLKKPITAMLSGNNVGVDKKLIDAATEILEPFIGTDIAAGTIKEIWTNKKDSGGKVYNEEDTVGRQIADKLNHLRKGLQPGVMSNLERTVLAAGGELSTSGKEYTLKDEAWAWLGHRTSTLNLGQSLIYKAYGFNNKKRSASSILGKVAGSRKKISDSDLTAAYESMMKSREKNYNEMIKYINGARKLGMPDADIRKSMSGGKVSKKDISNLMRGEIPKWSMSSQFTKSARDRAIASSTSQEQIQEIKAELRNRRRYIFQLAKEQNQR